MRIVRGMRLTIDLLGWASSAVLLLTILSQIHKQWAAGTSEGVSRWLFIGQIAASAGFTTYSWLVGNRVFVVTNALLLVSAVVGLGIVLEHRRRARRKLDPYAQPRLRRLAGRLVHWRQARSVERV